MVKNGRVLRGEGGVLYVTPPLTATVEALDDLQGGEGDGHVLVQPLIDQKQSGWRLGPPALFDTEFAHTCVGTLKRSKTTKSRWTHVVCKRQRRRIATPTPSASEREDEDEEGAVDNTSSRSNDVSSWLVADEDASSDGFEGGDVEPTGGTTDSEAVLSTVPLPQVDRMLHTALSAHLTPHVVRAIMGGAIHHVFKMHAPEEGVCWACQRQRTLRFASALHESVYMGRSCASKVSAGIRAMRALRRARSATQSAVDCTQDFIDTAHRVVREYQE